VVLFVTDDIILNVTYLSDHVFDEFWSVHLCFFVIVDVCDGINTAAAADSTLWCCEHC